MCIFAVNTYLIKTLFVFQTLVQELSKSKETLLPYPKPKNLKLRRVHNFVQICHAINATFQFEII